MVSEMTKEKNMVSGKVLKKIREERGWTQQQMSKEIGLSKQKISDKEVAGTVKSMRARHYNSLKNLGFSPQQLEGKEELPPKEPTSEYKIEMGLNVDLNFRAVMERYGVTKEFIVREAPLLFMAAAEEFLNKEREIVYAPDEDHGTNEVRRNDACVEAGVPVFDTPIWDHYRHDGIHVLGTAMPDSFVVQRE